jgi:hypothetical protein
MQWNIDKALTELFESWQNQKPDSISPLPPSGSNRRYFRITYGDQSCIGAFNPDIRENQAFLTLSRHFDGLGLPVPKVLATDARRPVLPAYRPWRHHPVLAACLTTRPSKPLTATPWTFTKNPSTGCRHSR